MRNIKFSIVFALLLAVAIILAGNVSAVCCEKTQSGGICLDVATSNYCDSAFRVDETTACQSTQHCSTGTCVNNQIGTCETSSVAACDPSLGGHWVNDKPENIPDCKNGCCLMGGGASLLSLVACRTTAADYSITFDFRDSITDFATCSSMAGPTTTGACVSQTAQGKICSVETREKCASENKEFHAGLLCSAPELGTICTMTDRTTCVDGKNEVYFVDSCENPANVYDSSKIGNVDYFTRIIDSASSEVCGYGNANKNELGCGNCNYLLGSTCGKASGTGASPTSGNYICRNLDCTYNGETKAHGSSWCSQPISDFESAKPGALSYRLYCYDGEVQKELCGLQRSVLCNQTDNLPVLGTTASCIANRWQDCIMQNDTRSCLNTNKRDCKVEKGLSFQNSSGDNVLIFNSDTGQSEKSVCVPKYTPGFNFWDPNAAILGIIPALTPSQICSFASSAVLGGYHASLVGGIWEAIEEKCFKNCVDTYKDWIVGKATAQEACFNKCPHSEVFANDGAGAGELKDVSLNQTWVIGRESLSSLLGDCGVKANYIGEPGYSKWGDLFIGDNITLTSIPGYSSYK